MLSKPIRSDEENALEKLKEKAEQLKTLQDEMKKANSYFRKNNSMVGYGDLSEEAALKLDEKIWSGYSWEKQPYPSYMLSNNNQNLRATTQRIKSLEREDTAENETVEYNTAKLGFEVIENKEDMRLQLFFNGKPSEKIRTELKSRGFKWAPTKDCWQRLLNDNARFALKGFIKHLEKSDMEM